jgi:hypothetical protein
MMRLRPGLLGRGQPGVDSRVNLLADSLEERVDNRVPVLRRELAMSLSGDPDFV